MAAPGNGGTNFHFDDLDAETVASENGWIGPDAAMPEQTTRDVDHMTVGVIRRDARRREEAGLAPLDYGGDPEEMESWVRHADADSASGEAPVDAQPADEQPADVQSADVQPVDDADMSDGKVQVMFAKFDEMFAGRASAPEDASDEPEDSAAHWASPSGRRPDAFAWTGGPTRGDDDFDPDEEPDGEPGDEPYHGDDSAFDGEAHAMDEAGAEAEPESGPESEPKPKHEPEPERDAGSARRHNDSPRGRVDASARERPREIDRRIMAWSLPPLVRRPPRGECVVSFEASGDPSRTQFGTVRGVPFSGTSLALAPSMMPDCFEVDPSRAPTFTGPREAVVYVRFAVPAAEMGGARLALSKAAWAATDGDGTLDEMMARALFAAHFSVARQLMAAHRVAVPLRDASWGVGGSSALVLSSAFQSRSNRAARIDMARRALSQALESERVPAPVISALASPLSTSVQVRGSTSASTMTGGHILGMPVELWVHVVRFSIDVR